MTSRTDFFAKPSDDYKDHSAYNAYRAHTPQIGPISFGRIMRTDRSSQLAEKLH